MKKLLFSAIFMAFAVCMMAQSVVLTEPFSNTWMRRLMTYGTPVGQDAENLYFFLNPRTNDSFKPKTWTDHVFIIDKSSMQRTDIPITVEAKYSFMGGVTSDDNVIGLYNSLNSKGDKVIFTIANVDKSSKGMTLNDNNSVSTTANPKFWPSYKTATSPNGKLLAALVMVTGKDYQLENLFAIVVNNEGEFVWSSQIAPEFGGKTFSLGNMVVDNDGNIYLPAYTCLMSGKNISDVKFMMIRANSDGTSSFTEGVNFGTPQNFTGKILSDGNVTVAGYYTDSKTNTATQSSGYFFYKFDTKSENFTDLRSFKFNDGYVQKEVWTRFATELGNQQYSISADDLYELADGSIVLCGEHRFVKETYNYQMNSTTYQLLTKNVLVSTLLPDGTSRFTMIEKQQSFASYMPTPEDWKPTSISYSAFAQGNDMYFLFNDDPKNIPYPGKSVVYCPSGMSFKKKWESVLMKLTPDQKLTQRVLPDPNQLLRGVEFTDGESFYASGVGKSEFFMTKFAIEE